MWKIMAWQHISQEVTLKGQMMQWMRLMMMWNDCEGDGCVRSECEENEDTDHADGDSDTDW